MLHVNIPVNLLIGFVGVTLSLISFSMRDMQSLRTVSICSNSVFIVYGLLEWQLPTLVLSAILLPLNLWRLRQIKRLVRDIENAKSDTPMAEWLLPHMHARHFKAGHVLFLKGDQADEIYFVQQGQVRLVEIGLLLSEGQLFGELGIFSSARQRTLSVSCATDCTLYVMTRDEVYRLYFQQPKLGFHLISLIVNRLTDTKIASQSVPVNPTPPSSQA